MYRCIGTMDVLNLAYVKFGNFWQPLVAFKLPNCLPNKTLYFMLCLYTQENIDFVFTWLTRPGHVFRNKIAKYNKLN